MENKQVKAKNYIELFSNQRDSDQKRNILYKNHHNLLITEPKIIKPQIRSKANSRSFKNGSNNSIKVQIKKLDKETPRFSLVSNSSLNSNDIKSEIIINDIDKLYNIQKSDKEAKKNNPKQLKQYNKVPETEISLSTLNNKLFQKKKQLGAQKSQNANKIKQNLNETLNITFNNSEQNVLTENHEEPPIKAFNHTFYKPKESNLFSFRESTADNILPDNLLTEQNKCDVTNLIKTKNIDNSHIDFIDDSFSDQKNNPFVNTMAIVNSKRKNNFIEPSTQQQENPADISFVKNRNTNEHFKLAQNDRHKTNLKTNAEYIIKTRSPPESYKNSFYQIKESASLNNSSNSDNSQTNSSVIYDKEKLKKNIVCQNKDNIILNRNTKKQYVKQSKAVQNSTKKRSKDIVKQENETFRNELNEILNSTQCSVRVKSPSLHRKPMAGYTEAPQFFIKKKKDEKEHINYVQKSLDLTMQPTINLDSVNSSFYNKNLTDKYRARLNCNDQNIKNAYYNPGYKSNIAPKNTKKRGNSSASDWHEKSSSKDSWLYQNSINNENNKDNSYISIKSKSDGHNAYQKILNRRKYSEPGKQLFHTRKLSEPDKHLEDIHRLQNEIYNNLEELKKERIDIKKKNRKMIIPGSLKLDTLIEKESTKSNTKKPFNSLHTIKKDNILENQDYTSIVIDKNNILNSKSKKSENSDKSKRFKSFDKRRFDSIVNKQKMNLNYNKKTTNTEKHINFDIRKASYDPPIKKSSDVNIIINKKVVDDFDQSPKKFDSFNRIVKDEHSSYNSSYKYKSSAKKTNKGTDEVIYLPGNKKANLFNQSCDFYNPIEAFKTKNTFEDEAKNFKLKGMKIQNLPINTDKLFNETNESRPNNKDIYNKSKDLLLQRKKAENYQHSVEKNYTVQDEVINNNLDLEFKSKKKAKSPPRVIMVSVENTKRTRLDK